MGLCVGGGRSWFLGMCLGRSNTVHEKNRAGMPVPLFLVNNSNPLLPQGRKIIAEIVETQPWFLWAEAEMKRNNVC